MKQRTVLAEDGDQLIPILCPIEYASGYEGQRIREHTSRDDVLSRTARRG